MFCPQVNKNIPSGYECDANPSNPEKDNKQPGDDTNTSNKNEKIPNEGIKNDELIVSDSIAERIENDGGVSEDRLTCYDDFWLEKLSKLEEQFAEEKLNVGEANKILNKLSSYTCYENHNACGSDAMKLIQCYAMFERQSIRCGEFAESFIKCVDKSLRNAVGRSHKMADPTYRDKMTYKEKFYKGI